MFRKTLFWVHLAAGVLASLVIVTMSFTGVVLTYERQIKTWLEEADYVDAGEQNGRLPLEQLAFTAARQNPDYATASAVIANDPGAPVEFSAGRRSPSLYLNPYTGMEMEVGSPAVNGFFSTMTSFHRWFSISGENRGIARAVTGAANLVFLFLIVSGMYLWLPKIRKWVMFRSRLLFAARPASARARDFNWHHVFGIWSAVPLAVVVATGAVFSYGWASDLVYIVAGDDPPGSGSPGGESTFRAAGSADPARADFMPLDQLVAQASDYIGDWRQISVSLPKESSRTVEFSIDQGNGAQPHLRHTLSLNRHDATVVSHQPFTEESPGRRARSFVRYLHTGEVYGLAGQTIAGLVSLTSLFMVWTGLALAYRRLVRPLFAKRKQAP